MATTKEKREAFRRLHEAGCFVTPNPWDAGSAKWLGHAGFKAIATTSAGFAWSKGLDDGAVTRDMVLGHVAELSAASHLPLNVDFENGFADAPDEVAANVAACAAAGAAGLSVEDFTGDAAEPLYPLDLAARRIAAARAAAPNLVLTARSEGFIRGRPDLAATIERLRAYAQAGADVLFAPGLPDAAAVSALVQAVAPKPVNVLVGAPGGFNVAQLAALGVRRISTGGALARAAWGGFIRAAQEIAGAGTFEAFADAAPGRDITAAFRS